MLNNRRGSYGKSFLLDPQVKEDRDKQLEFFAGIDKMWLNKNPKVDFALQEPVKESIRIAYQKMLNNHGSDFA